MKLRGCSNEVSKEDETDEDNNEGGPKMTTWSYSEMQDWDVNEGEEKNLYIQWLCTV